MSNTADVIVVGAGPVGLTTAFLLARAGIAVIVFEASPTIPHELRASTWHPPTLDMLEPIGLTKELIEAGRITPTWQIRLLETGEKAEFDLSVLRDDTNHPYRLQCEQSVYCDAVVERLRAMPHVEFRFGETVVAAGQSDKRVWVERQRDDGQRERTERCDAAYVIGCDGARSVVREAMGARFEGSAYPEITILATTRFPFETVLEGLSGVNYIWKEGGTFSLLHLPQLWRCAFYPDLGQSPEAAVTDEAIQRHIDEISPEIGAIEIIEKRAYRVHQRIADTYRTGRLFIAGDAAHLNSPKGGMGMNGGIHDAFCLARRLIEVMNGGAPALLDRYERERRPIALEDIIAQADSNRARMNETGAAARRASLRDLQAIAADPARAHAFLLRSSMIEGLRKAAMIAANV